MHKLKKSLYHLKGWHTDQKIVVIESDDWGSIRMPNKRILQKLTQLYSRHFDSPYYSYDTLADKSDLTSLFEVLSSVKGRDGRQAVLTANTIVANPDFDKIESTQFREYHYEIFTKTLSNYYSIDPFPLWKQGIEEGLFYPQLHGREHVNVSAWLLMLQNNDPLMRKVFEYRTFAVDCFLNKKKKNLSASLDIIDLNDIQNKTASIKEACKLFEQIFDYRSQSFIAPSYTWDQNIENVLADEEVRYIQGILSQKMPSYKLSSSLKTNYLGKKNKRNQTYLIRNIFFEPTLSNSSINSIIDKALKRIDLFFRLNKPIIISSHRLNYVGSIDMKNRDQNLMGLKSLLQKIIQRWPSCIFLTSDQLGNLMEKSKKFEFEA